MRTLRRSGLYYRVADPTWRDPLDTSFAKTYGGRWNPPGRFGALYLNATIAVACANARRAYDNEIATLFDLRPEQRPDLQHVRIDEARFVDVVTPAGLRALKLPLRFPIGVDHVRCQRIATRAYEARKPGIACRSAVASAIEAGPVGEELAVFDTSVALVHPGPRIAFAQWYPLEREA